MHNIIIIFSATLLVRVVNKSVKFHKVKLISFRFFLFDNFSIEVKAIGYNKATYIHVNYINVIFKCHLEKAGASVFAGYKMYSRYFTGTYILCSVFL